MWGLMGEGVVMKKIKGWSDGLKTRPRPRHKVSED
jgi:hypothetical protein